jgi:hypothetical protein
MNKILRNEIIKNNSDIIKNHIYPDCRINLFIKNSWNSFFDPQNG